MNQHPYIVRWLSNYPGSFDHHGIITPVGWMNLVASHGVSVELVKHDLTENEYGQIILATFSYRARLGAIYSDGESTCNADGVEKDLATYASTCAKIIACKSLFRKLLPFDYTV
jgi:hypothetical protein